MLLRLRVIVVGRVHDIVCIYFRFRRRPRVRRTSISNFEFAHVIDLPTRFYDTNFLFFPWISAGLIEAFHYAQCNHVFGANGRHRCLHSAAVQSSDKMSTACARLSLRLRIDGTSAKPTIASADQSAGKPEAFRWIRNKVSRDRIQPQWAQSSRNLWQNMYSPLPLFPVSRLGLLANSPTGRNQLTAPPMTQITMATAKSMSKEKPLSRSEERPLPPSAPIKRFDSSLGSDTGTSTRESECSEEHSPVSPLSPISSTKASLYDSLAAELRAKLNGNGPPLLLPPRDYDTVHRSKGNLAATELRRCRNSLIVGVGGPGSKYGVSSRGSSGIGSDLAPSPERHELHSSSGEYIRCRAVAAYVTHAFEICETFMRSIPSTRKTDIHFSMHIKFTHAQCTRLLFVRLWRECVLRILVNDTCETLFAVLSGSMTPFTLSRVASVATYLFLRKFIIYCFLSNVIKSSATHSFFDLIHSIYAIGGKRIFASFNCYRGI